MFVCSHDNFIRYIVKAQFANWVIKRRRPKWINDQDIYSDRSRRRNNQTEALGRKKKINMQQVHEGEQERSETTNKKSKWNIWHSPVEVLWESLSKNSLLLTILIVSCIYKHADRTIFLAQPTSLTHFCTLQKTLHLFHILCPLFQEGRQQSQTGGG